MHAPFTMHTQYTISVLIVAINRFQILILMCEVILWMEIIALFVSPTMSLISCTTAEHLCKLVAL